MVSPVLVSLAASVGEVLTVSSLVIIEPPWEQALTRSSVQRLLAHRETAGLDAGLLAAALLQEPTLTL